MPSQTGRAHIGSNDSNAQKGRNGVVYRPRDLSPVNKLKVAMFPLPPLRAGMYPIFGARKRGKRDNVPGGATLGHRGKQIREGKIKGEANL